MSRKFSLNIALKETTIDQRQQTTCVYFHVFDVYLTVTVRLLKYKVFFYILHNTIVKEKKSILHCVHYNYVGFYFEKSV